MSTPTQERLDQLKERRSQLAGCAQSILVEARSAGREQLSAGESHRFREMAADLKDLDQRIADYEGELKRANLDGPLLSRLSGRGGGQTVNSAATLAPLGHDHEQLRRAFGQVGRGETAVLESRDFSTATSLIPADLGPILPVFPSHEQRLLAKLPGIGITVPSLAYVEVTSVTGNAGITLEGAPKPEIVIPGVQKVATARKIAGHTGVSWEAYSGDYDAFVTAVQGELMGKIVDAENDQLYAGTGEANGQVNGLTTNPLILTLDGSTFTDQPGPWDAIEAAIALMRAGAALAEPNLALTTPGTWSAIRRVTNLQGNYYVAADPSTAEVNTAWGVPVLVSKAFTPGTFTLVDTTRYGRVVVRESLVTRIGYSGTDFTDNIVRFVSEERITQTIERPHAICKISNLPTVAALEGDADTSSSKSKSK
jgi:HK97 family phage major capsid protein